MNYKKGSFYVLNRQPGSWKNPEFTQLQEGVYNAFFGVYHSEYSEDHWVLTHFPTGYALGRFYYKKDAIEAADRIGKLGIDFSQSDSNRLCLDCKVEVLRIFDTIKKASNSL